MAKDKIIVEGEETAVPKSSMELMLEKIQADMDAMKKANEAKDSQIKMLTEIANESRKEKWGEKNLKNKIVSIVKVSTLDGKIIVSWRNIIDEVFKLPSGLWEEKQINEYVTNTGETITMPLVEAVRKIVKVEAEVLSITADQEIDGNDNTVENTYTYKLKTKDDVEVIINNKFIN